jgi:hypothetical protein
VININSTIFTVADDGITYGYAGWQISLSRSG